MVQYTDTVAETVSTAGALVPSGVYLRTATETLTALDALLDPARAYAVLAEATINMTPAAVGSWGEALLITLDIVEAAAPAVLYHLTLTQVAQVAEALRAGEGVTITDLINLTEALEGAAGLVVLDALGLTDALGPSTAYSLSLVDAITSSDSLRRFLSGLIAETVEMSTTQLSEYRFSGVAADTVSITPTAAPALVLRVTAADEMEITPVEALAMTYTTSILEGIELSAAYLSPGEGITTWVVNAANGAVTEYSNFNFNSMTRFGHKYLGANASGIYELNGDTDDGASIVSVIASGLMQMTEARYTQFRAAYIATTTSVEGVQQFTLKLITNDGVERVYGVNIRNNETTKIHLGKGLRTRYMSFELTSVGQDFDLDTLEFVPIVATRRV